MPRPFAPAALFAALLGSFCLLSIGCGEPQSASGATHKPKVSSGSFDIGVPDKYRRPRVYSNFANSHGVYLVTGHGMIVALAAECTNDDHGPSLVRFDNVAGIYRCPTCSAKYTRDGLHIGTSQTDLSLTRCRIRPSGKIYDRDTTLVVDPGKRFAQEDQQWSKHTSFYPLEEIVRDRETKREIARQQERAQKLEQPPLRWRD